MAEWCLEHPWMTFFLILAAIIGTTHVGECLAKAIGRKKEVS